MPIRTLTWPFHRLLLSIAPTAAAPRNELGVSAVRQIAQTVPSAASQPVEVRLQPEELGKVQITLVAGADDTMLVNIVAERSETLALLRRHIDILGQDFAKLGYDSTEFSFENGSDRQDRRDGIAPNDVPDTDGAHHEGASPDQTRPATPRVTGGLDLRL